MSKIDVFLSWGAFLSGMPSNDDLGSLLATLRDELYSGATAPQVGFLTLLDMEARAYAAAGPVFEEYCMLQKECNELLSASTDREILGLSPVSVYRM